jgi:hypothetical protein
VPLSSQHPVSLCWLLRLHPGTPTVIDDVMQPGGDEASAPALPTPASPTSSLHVPVVSPAASAWWCGVATTLNANVLVVSLPLVRRVGSLAGQFVERLRLCVAGPPLRQESLSGRHWVYPRAASRCRAMAAKAPRVALGLLPYLPQDNNAAIDARAHEVRCSHPSTRRSMPLLTSHASLKPGS